MATLDIFGLMDAVDADPGVIEARHEYNQALDALRAVLPSPVFDALWRLALDIDGAAGSAVVAAAEAGFAAAGGKLREVL